MSGSHAQIGLGLAALGRPAYINLGHGEDVHGVTAPDALEARCHEVLDAAWGAGVRYFDAARGYGRAEAFLKDWLDDRRIEPGTLTVASKWGYAYTANWDPNADVHERKDHSAAHLEQQWALTRAHLWEYLDIYQIHSATLDTGVLQDPAVIERLAALRDDRGLRIGLSLSGAEQSAALDAALEVRAGGRRLFEVVQATANLLERSVVPALERARAAGLTVVVKEGLANGRLAGRDASGRSPEVQAALAEAARAEVAPPDAVALAALLAQPWADVVLSGASTVAQLESNLRARDVTPERARALWASTSPEAPEAYWAHRKTFAWT
jgi:aryl-alcohol dehydrogenase-like predicted oxidoreductase